MKIKIMILLLPTSLIIIIIVSSVVRGVHGGSIALSNFNGQCMHPYQAYSSYIMSLIPAAFDNLYQSDRSTQATKIDEASLEETLATIIRLDCMLVAMHISVSIT